MNGHRDTICSEKCDTLYPGYSTHLLRLALGVSPYTVAVGPRWRTDTRSFLLYEDEGEEGECCHKLSFDIAL